MLPHMLPSSGNYLHVKNLRYQLIPIRDVDDQKILQSDWMRGKISHSQPKVVVPDATFA